MWETYEPPGDQPMKQPGKQADPGLPERPLEAEFPLAHRPGGRTAGSIALGLVGALAAFVLLWQATSDDAAPEDDGWTCTVDDGRGEQSAPDEVCQGVFDDGLLDDGLLDDGY